MADDASGQPDSPVMVQVPKDTSSAGGSSEEDFVAVDNVAGHSPVEDDDEDEGEFMRSEELDAKPVPAAAPKPSARASTGGAGPSGLQVTSFGPNSEAPPVPSGTANVSVSPHRAHTIDVKEGYRARLLVGAARAKDRVKEVSSTDIKFNCVVMILVGSLTQLFASIQYTGKDATIFMDPEIGRMVRESSSLGDYAMSVGLISTFVSLGYMTLCILSPTTLSTPSKTLLGGKMVLNVQNAAAVLLGVWWTVGAGVGTFQGPHLVAGNGFFGNWLALAGTIRLINATFGNAPADLFARYSGPNGQASATSKRCVTSLMVCALVLLLASMHVVFGELSFHSSHYVRGQSVWALIVSCLALRDGSMLLMMQSADVVRKYVAGWQLLLWLATAIVVTATYRAPFQVASNGYFAVWLGTASAATFALEEFQQAVTAATPYKATATYTAAGLVLIIESSQFLGQFDENTDKFACINLYSGVLDECSSAMVGLGVAYGTITFAVGLGLMILMYVHAGQPPSHPLVAPAFVRLRTCLEPAASFLLNGPMMELYGLKLTPLKALGAFLVAFAIAIALCLTYFFPPFTDIDNGFLACWISVASAALLLQDPPQDPTDIEQPRNLAVITTISGDAAAAELGVTDIDHRASVALDEGRPNVAAERPSKKLLPATGAQAKLPLVAVLAISTFLVMIAAADRLGGEREGVAAGVVDAEGECTWALICCALTWAILLVRYAIVDYKIIQLDDNNEYLVRASLSSVLAGMWTISAIVLTFIGPFLDTGNGYIATAAAFGASVALVLDDFAVQSILLASRPLQH